MTRLTHNRDLHKTISYFSLHLMVGFTIAWLFTGSIAMAGGIALIEPLANALIFYLHEKYWQKKAPHASVLSASPCHGHMLATHPG